MVVRFTEQVLQSEMKQNQFATNNIWFKMVRYFLSGVKSVLVTQVPKSVILFEFDQRINDKAC